MIDTAHAGTVTNGFGDMTPRVTTQVGTHPITTGTNTIVGAQTALQVALHIRAKACEMVSRRVRIKSMMF